MSDAEGRFWTGQGCPRDDCDGTLGQQDRYNVMCRSCEEVWTHGVSAPARDEGERTHQLQKPDGRVAVSTTEGDR